MGQDIVIINEAAVLDEVDRQYAETAAVIRASERERIARIIERELYALETDHGDADKHHREGWNARTRDLVRRLRDEKGCDTLCV